MWRARTAGPLEPPARRLRDEPPASTPCPTIAEIDAQRRDIERRGLPVEMSRHAVDCERQQREAARSYRKACIDHDFERAKIYFTNARNPSLAQICLKEGFDPRL